MTNSCLGASKSPRLQGHGRGFVPLRKEIAFDTEQHRALAGMLRAGVKALTRTSPLVRTQRLEFHHQLFVRLARLPAGTLSASLSQQPAACKRRACCSPPPPPLSSASFVLLLLSHHLLPRPPSWPPRSRRRRSRARSPPRSS